MQATRVQTFALLFIHFDLYTNQNQLYSQSHYTTCLEPDCMTAEITVLCHKIFIAAHLLTDCETISYIDNTYTDAAKYE